MGRLTEVVAELAGREGVQAVVVLSADGLAIQQVARESLDADSLAALTASVVQYAGRLGTGAAAGAFRTGVLEYEQRLVVIAQVGSGESLAILAAPSADVGPLLYDLQQQRPALAALF
ncbi:MAG TPA: roadblock/LC7 domain-containing protein [Gemmatimonadales bacterium]|nr:roadblock/LC7 domain-containing protein [Gemmatimonadales bacterium]